VIGLKLKRTAIAKIMKMFDCCLSGKQLTIKSGIAGFCISQFTREKSKGLPMGA
jgi:hypothetical protein